jgi:hypothetical protein
MAAALWIAGSSGATAASLNQAQWSRVLADLEPAFAPPLVAIHYGPAAAPALLAADLQVIDIRPDTTRAWDTLIGRAGPTSLAGVALSGWFSVFRRLRLGGSLRYVPIAKTMLGGPALAVQVLDGTSSRSSFLFGAAGPYSQTDDWRVFAPELFLEWGTELMRTAGRPGRGPWIVYLGAHVDQAARITLPRGGSTVDAGASVRHTYFRGFTRVRQGPLQVAAEFGGQPGPLLVYGVNVSWLLGGE